MELDYCACGKKVINLDSYYCSEECRILDDDSSQYSRSHNSQLAVNPPQNLHFSITIPPNLFKASDSNSATSSSSSFNSNLSSSFTSGYDHEDYNYVYNSHYDDNNKYNDDDDVTAYLSRSSPINIPSRARTPCEPELEINKGTFGQDKNGF